MVFSSGLLYFCWRLYNQITMQLKKTDHVNSYVQSFTNSFLFQLTILEYSCIWLHTWSFLHWWVLYQTKNESTSWSLWKGRNSFGKGGIVLCLRHLVRFQNMNPNLRCAAGFMWHWAKNLCVLNGDITDGPILSTIFPLPPSKLQNSSGARTVLKFVYLVQREPQSELIPY